MFREDILKYISSDIHSRKEIEQYLNGLIGECYIYVDQEITQSLNFSISNVISNILDLDYTLDIDNRAPIIANYKGELYPKLEYVDYKQIDQFIKIRYINLTSEEHEEYEKYEEYDTEINKNNINIFILLNNDSKKTDAEYLSKVGNKFHGKNIYLIFSEILLDLDGLYNEGLLALPLTSDRDSIQIKNVEKFLRIEDSRKRQIEHMMIKRYHFLLNEEGEINNSKEEFQKLLKKVSEDKEKIKDVFEKIYNELVEKYLLIKKDLTSLKKVELEIERDDVSVNPFSHKLFVERHFKHYGEKIKEEIKKATDKINYWIFIYFDEYKTDDNAIEVGKPTYYHVLNDRYSNGHIMLDGLGSILKVSFIYRAVTSGSWVEELAENIIDDTKKDFLPYFDEYIENWKEQVKSNVEEKYVNIIKNIEQTFNTI